MISPHLRYVGRTCSATNAIGEGRLFTINGVNILPEFEVALWDKSDANLSAIMTFSFLLH
jgi:hypothetical protein